MWTKVVDSCVCVDAYHWLYHILVKLNVCVGGFLITTSFPTNCHFRPFNLALNTRLSIKLFSLNRGSHMTDLTLDASFKYRVLLLIDSKSRILRTTVLLRFDSSLERLIDLREVNSLLWWRTWLWNIQIHMWQGVEGSLSATIAVPRHVTLPSCVHCRIGRGLILQACLTKFCFTGKWLRFCSLPSSVLESGMEVQASNQVCASWASVERGSTVSYVISTNSGLIGRVTLA